MSNPYAELAQQFTSFATNSDEQGVTLPFPACTIQVDSTGGNYLIPADRLDEFLGTTELQPPPGFTATQVRLGGKRQDAHVAPTIIVAGIARRGAWVGEDGQLQPMSVRYQLLPASGGKWVSRVHVLALLLDGKLQPWAPIIITARSTQGGNLDRILRGWDATTKNARRDLAADMGIADLPAPFLAIPLGFGNEQRVGKGNATSSIYPVVGMADGLDATKAKSLLLSTEVIRLAADLRNQAAEWVNAWSADALLGTPAPVQRNGNGYEHVADDEADEQPEPVLAYSHGL